MLKLKCDLCDKKVWESELKLVHDRFREKEQMYCKECVEDYEGASSSFGSKAELDAFVEFFPHLRS